MSSTLDDLRTSDLLPTPLAGDAGMLAASEASDTAIRGVVRDLPLLQVTARIPEMVEPELSLLAWQWHVDVWDETWDVTVKRQVILRSVQWHRRKGTVWAVQDALRTVLQDDAAGVSEWFRYGGEPGRFKIVGTRFPDQAAYIRAVEAATAMKNVRSHLDGISVPADTSGGVEPSGLARVGGEIGATLWCSPDVDPVTVQPVGLATLGYTLAAELPRPYANVEPSGLAGTGLVRWGWPINIRSGA